MQFDFGQNWAEYSAHALTAERAKQAQEAFAALIASAGAVAEKSFLDIGFGQGLSLLSAAAAGAQVVGIDINPTCEEVLKRNRRFFPAVRGDISVIIGSILDEQTVRLALALNPQGGPYDVVHSWGVLHHTGDMNAALRNAARLVKPGGHLILALYNRHWSSPAWLLIKYTYCKAPRFLQKQLVRALLPIIYVAKWLVTLENPRKQSRGMHFFYDVVDWVGGYPYEYASPDEVLALVEPLGFRRISCTPSQVPTGCNEFIFMSVGRTS
jgi:2-polyprenyl-6-hydroxyphenyl methylase/3-demethylubiquinone-9 3-methyltransferase